MSGKKVINALIAKGNSNTKAKGKGLQLLKNEDNTSMNAMSKCDPDSSRFRHLNVNRTSVTRQSAAPYDLFEVPDSDDAIMEEICEEDDNEFNEDNELQQSFGHPYYRGSKNFWIKDGKVYDFHDRAICYGNMNRGRL